MIIMKTAKVTLWGKYHYTVKLEGNETLQQLAFKISLEIHKKENKTKFTDHPRTYNYVYECLLRKSCLNFRINTEDSINNEQELLKAANELNSNSEFIQKKCSCLNEFKYVNVDCPICNGHGYIYEHQDYRLGYTQSNTLIIDIDGKDILNLKNVKEFYENALECKFTTISTKKGYWLFSDKKYNNLQSWIYDNCRVLCPSLEWDCFVPYSEALRVLDDNEEGEFQRATPEIIKTSGLYKVPDWLYFDVAFTFLSIKRERSTIRITKKGKNDKIEQITI